MFSLEFTFFSYFLKKLNNYSPGCGLHAGINNFHGKVKSHDIEYVLIKIPDFPKICYCYISACTQTQGHQRFSVHIYSLIEYFSSHWKVQKFLPFSLLCF